MLTAVRRLLVRMSWTITAIGASCLLYGASVFASIPHTAASPVTGLSPRDLIMTLISLVMVIGGSYLAASRRELQRADTLNANAILRLEEVVKKNQENHTSLQDLIRVEYQSKEDITRQMTQLESSFMRELQALYRLLELKKGV